MLNELASVNSCGESSSQTHACSRSRILQQFSTKYKRNEGIGCWGWGKERRLPHSIPTELTGLLIRIMMMLMMWMIDSVGVAILVKIMQ